ncbi:MAG: inositol monophosphatase family protein [Solirubrobacteraceae bacterium]
MTAPGGDDDLGLACRAARTGGLEALRHFGRTLRIDLKGAASDPVSDADRAAEEAVVALLAAERPADGVVAEEGSARSGERVWVVDPLDGTLNFLNGIPQFCCQVALSDADGVLVSAIHWPCEDRLYWAARGEGAWRDGERLAVPDRSLDASTIWMWLDVSRMRDEEVAAGVAAIGREAAAILQPGSGGQGLAMTAAGQVGGWALAHCEDWDWLPGKLLVEEAGGATAETALWRLAGSAATVAALERLVGYSSVSPE